jgi:hypothetical protein
MKNPCLEAALSELAAAGIRDVERACGGKHLQLRWRVNGHAPTMYSLPVTPSDVRSSRNTRSDVRRLLREDGLLIAVEKKGGGSETGRSVHTSGAANCRA